MFSSQKNSKNWWAGWIYTLATVVQLRQKISIYKLWIQDGRKTTCVCKQGFPLSSSDSILSVPQCYWTAVVFSSRTDLCGHMTNCKTQFSPSLSSCERLFFAPGVNWLIKVWNANPPLECQLYDIFANHWASLCVHEKWRKYPFD